MAQIVDNVPNVGAILGRGIGQGTAASLERLIQEKARKIEEKHRYERNLEFLKGASIPNAEQVAHGSDEHILQLLKGKPVGTTINIGGQGGLSPYDQLFAQAEGLNQPMQQGQQAEEIDYENPSPSVYARPEIQQALQDYMAQPEIQQQYGPELLAKAQQKLQSYAQQGPSRKEEILQPAMGQQAKPEQGDLYQKMIAASQTPFQLNKAKAYNEAKNPLTKEAKLSPQNDRFIKKIEGDVAFADDILPLINEIEDIVSRGEYKHGPSQVLKAKIDPSLLSGDTQQLYNNLQALLTKQAAAESVGQRGSDLLRKMVAEGKLSIGQEPSILQKRLEAIKKDVLKKKHSASVAYEIETSGKIPVNLADKVRSRVQAEQERFDRLSDPKKVEYLLANPQKLTYIRDIDYNGQVWVRDEDNNWVRA